MAEIKAGSRVTLTGTVVEIEDGIALVQVDKSFPSGTTTIAVRLGLPVEVLDPSDEDRIRDAMAEAHDHPGRTVTR